MTPLRLERNIRKLLELETSNLVCSFVSGMPSGRTNNFPESGCGLGHVTLTIFGSTVGYPSDSLASCLRKFIAHVARKPASTLFSCFHTTIPTTIGLYLCSLFTHRCLIPVLSVPPIDLYSQMRYVKDLGLVFYRWEVAFVYVFWHAA